MPGGRPAIDLEPYKEDLIALFSQGFTYDNLKEWLEEQDVSVSIRTIKRWMKNWEVTKRIPTEVEKSIKEWISSLFLNYGLQDSEILEVLRGEGYEISSWTLVRLRFELGLKRRVKTVETQAAADGPSSTP
ncbi:HD superfamily hydrolase [Pyrenophora seminiperda CCB06]|uniref:HD superfamily hydrolase n=1 Tax=Pyrenophora seminiperda CCB06 TaxID=1302712 RepID=A0A3M7M1A9_9PLEO|nr:HD superfamily hydrolase [Pyrenophora seminiperda CCB06]